MKILLKWFSRGAEFIAAMALAAIFVTFLFGIFFRYAPFLEPIGWSVVLISLLWVWLIFFGCAFIVREPEHVTFDILYLSAPRNVRKVMAVISATLLIAAMVWSFPAVWDAVFGNRLMELKKIPTLRVPFAGGKIAIKWLFAPFVMLMVVVTLRSLWRIATILRSGLPKTELQALKAGDASETEADQ